MYPFPKDHLRNYDPTCIEEHNDSSDFDDPCVPVIGKKEGNHRFLKPQKICNKRQKKSPHPIRHDFDQYPVKLVKDHSSPKWEPKPIQQSNIKDQATNKKHKSKAWHPDGDRPSIVQSKLSVFRQKVIPCLSNLFKRSKTKNDQLSVLYTNYAGNTRNASCGHSCQQKSLRKRVEARVEHGNYEPRHVKKLFTKQKYSVNPVYAIETNIHTASTPYTLNTGKQQRTRNPKKLKNQCSNCSSSSSDSEQQLSEEVKRETLDKRRRYKREFMKEHLNYQQNQQFKNHQQQCPSKDHRSFQVFSTPYQQSKTNTTPPENQYIAEIPSSSSSFWEFLFNKINKKYQVQNLEMPQPCQCSSRDQVPPAPRYCQGSQQSPPGNTCACPNSKPISQATRSFQSMRPSDYSRPVQSPPSICPHMMSPQLSFTKPPKIKSFTEKVYCECHKKKSKALSRGMGSSAATGVPKLPPESSSPGGTKPCQDPHNGITSTLADLYNKEVLCIHNPPCVLINGCLNLPKSEDAQQLYFCPFTESKMTAYYQQKNLALRCEQACQYNIPCEKSPSQDSCYKIEKNIQSICHHDPPCEVVRGCHKAKYDPKLINSCVHVPMCDEVPECIIDRDNPSGSCEHHPRCPGIPLCSRNFTVLTAKQNFSAQVKPRSNLVCRHVPPCVKIPNCLGVEAVLDCIHQPACDSLPACCRSRSRKSNKQMVSVSSQYPNSCRIV